MSKFASLKGRFSGGIVVVFATFLEYNARDILLELGWSPEMIEVTEQLREGLPGTTRELGFEYLDWSSIVTDYTKETGSIFQRFDLYVDHVHLSPKGNRLAAEQVYSLLNHRLFASEKQS